MTWDLKRRGSAETGYIWLIGHSLNVGRVCVMDGWAKPKALTLLNGAESLIKYWPSIKLCYSKLVSKEPLDLT